jgi:hypothetical protein
VIAFGASSIRRFVGYDNTYNVSLHALGSFHLGATESSVASQGELLFGQFSWEPRATNDVVYLNAFWAVDQFTAPARGTLAGGPLGQVGLSFAAASLGRFGPALSNQARTACGGSLGYQMFFDETRQQITCELAARLATDAKVDSGLAGSVRYQTAIAGSHVFVFDSFVAKSESLGVSPGVRCELTRKF